MSKQPRSLRSPLSAFMILTTCLVGVNLVAFFLAERFPSEYGAAMLLGCVIGILLTLAFLGVTEKLPSTQGIVRRSENRGLGSRTEPWIGVRTAGDKAGLRPQKDVTDGERTAGVQANIGPQPSASPTESDLVRGSLHPAHRRSIAEAQPQGANQVSGVSARERVVPALSTQDRRVLDSLVSSSQAIAGDVRSVLRSLEELRQDVARGFSQSLLPSLEEQHHETVQRIQEANDRAALVEDALGAKLEQLLAHQRSILLQEARRLDRLLDERLCETREAMSSRSACLLQTLVSFPSIHKATDFVLLDKAVARILDEIECRPELNLLKKGVDELAEVMDIRERLESLLVGIAESDLMLADAAGLLGELAERYSKMTDRPPTSVQDDLIEPLRRRILQHLEAEYLAFVQGRSPYKSQEPLNRLARQLDLEITEILLGKTRPEPNLHEIVSITHEPQWSVGTIANVLSMGYRDLSEGHIVKAKVIVNRS